MTRLRSLSRFLPLAVLLGATVLLYVPTAGAQVRVDLALRRSLFVRFEPVIATVTITNLSGREIELSDDGNHKWFSFNIETASGALVPPYNSDYSLQPVRIAQGERIARSVNITPLYPISDYGVYRVRAVVYDAGSGRYFSSNPPLNIEVTEGRVLWQQTVGVPSGEGVGSSRTVTLLSHRLPEQTQLYVRIEDKENGLIFCMTQLGRVVVFDKPRVELDSNNDIHILQNTSPRNFLYSMVTLDGKVQNRREYAATQQTRPTLVRSPNGGIEVVGGIYKDPAAIAAEKAAPKPPGVSDRPVPLPKSQ